MIRKNLENQAWYFEWQCKNLKKKLKTKKAQQNGIVMQAGIKTSPTDLGCFFNNLNLLKSAFKDLNVVMINKQQFIRQNYKFM